MFTVLTTSDFDKQFKKLDKSVQKLIQKWIVKHLIDCKDPRTVGKGLTGGLKGLWRYRIGEYRLLVDIQDSELIIIAVAIDKRSQVYGKS